MASLDWAVGKCESPLHFLPGTLLAALRLLLCRKGLAHAPFHRRGRIEKHEVLKILYCFCCPAVEVEAAGDAHERYAKRIRALHLTSRKRHLLEFDGAPLLHETAVTGIL